MQLVSRLGQRLRIWFARMDPYLVRGVARYYRKGMQLFWWYGVFLSLSSAFVDSYITLFILSLGGSRLQVGSLSSLASLFGLLLPLPGAQWAARWGKRKPVVVISFGLRYVALLAALSAPLFAAGPALVGVVIGCFALRAAFLHLGNSPWTSFVGELMPPARRGRYFSSRKMAMAIATLIFVPAAGQLIALFREPTGYQVSFFVALVCGAVGLYLFSRIPERAPVVPAKQERLNLAFWKLLRRTPTFWRFALTAMLFNFSWQFSAPYFGVYQVEVLGATARIIGWMAMIQAFMRVVGQYIWGRLVDRRGAAWTFTLCMLFIPLLPFLWLPLTSPWQLVFVLAPSGFLWAGQEVAIFNLIFDLAGEERQTEAIASYNTLQAMANIAGPLLGGQVVQLLGYRWDFVLSGIGRFAAAILFLAVLKPFDLRKFVRLRLGHRAEADST